MTTYASYGKNIAALPLNEEKLIIEYMQQTNQGRITLLLRGKQYLIELYDGATNEHQEPGYHDAIRVMQLPPMITLPGLQS